MGELLCGMFDSMRWLLVILLLTAAATAGPLERIKLANGLTVLVRPVTGGTHVAVVTLYSVGGNHDPKGRSGLAHLLEHLYLRAAAGASSAQGAVEAYDRIRHARTGPRHTLIARVITTDLLPAELSDVAWRMGDLKIAESDLVRERDSVREEGIGNFEVFSMNALCALASERARPSPHGGRRGGFPADLEKIGVEEVRTRWRKYYKPRNAVVVIAGAVRPKELGHLITRLFGSIPAGEQAPPCGPALQTRPGVETVSLPWTTDAAPYACYAWATPEPDSDDFAPFLVLIARMVDAVAGDVHTEVRYTPFISDTAILASRAGAKRRFARLDSVVDALAVPLRSEDMDRVYEHFGVLLGLVTPRDNFLSANPEIPSLPMHGEEGLYVFATGIGLRELYGFDASKLARRLRALTEAELDRARGHLARRAAVVMEARRIGK